MVAATLVLLCTKPFEVIVFGEVPWLLAVPSIAVIGREVIVVSNIHELHYFLTHIYLCCKAPYNSVISLSCCICHILFTWDIEQT